MNDPLLMKKGKCLTKLTINPHDRPFIKFRTMTIRLQSAWRPVRTENRIHRIVGRLRPRINADIIDLYKPRMLQAEEHPPFGEESLAKEILTCACRRKDLERDTLSRGFVNGIIDRSHTTLA